jgi:hypothetical protein
MRWPWGYSSLYQNFAAVSLKTFPPKAGSMPPALRNIPLDIKTFPPGSRGYHFLPLEEYAMTISSPPKGNCCPLPGGSTHIRWRSYARRGVPGPEPLRIQVFKPLVERINNKRGIYRPAFGIKRRQVQNGPGRKKDSAMKKVVFLLVLAALVVGGVFAQEKTANVKRNWISGELSLVGAGLRYEFMINDKLSVGVNTYWTSLLFIFNDIGANVVGRFYPWGKKFHAGLGLGYGIHTGLTARVGFDIVPEVGWKIDVGNPGGFFLDPLIQLPLTLGKEDYWNAGFGMSIGFRASLGLGWAF